MTYGWKITTDYLVEPNDPPGYDKTGTIGPSSIQHNHHNELTIHNRPMTPYERWRMYDDDGELYYEGIIVGEYTGFEPLDDFGMPDSGCTEIRYYRPSEGKWVTL